MILTFNGKLVFILYLQLLLAALPYPPLIKMPVFTYHIR